MSVRHLTKYLLLSIACLLAAINHLAAQDFDEGNFIRYTRLEGLSNNYISGIVQDSTGYIWVATHKGINRFDGRTFRPIFKSSPHSPLPDNLLVSMHLQNSNEIIGATRSGAFAFEPSTGRYKQFTIPCDSSIYFWTNHTFDAVKDRKDNYIVSSKTGLYAFNNQGKLIKRYDHHTPRDVGKLEMLFGTTLSFLPDGSTLQQNALLGSLYNPGTNQIDTMYVVKRADLKQLLTDSSGTHRISWGGKNGELFILNNEKNCIDIADISSARNCSSVMPFLLKNELGATSNMFFVNDSVIIITCENRGFFLFHYNEKTKQLTCDGKKNFGGNICTAICKDRDGRLWIGTADGLYKQNLHNSIFSVNDLSQQSTALLDHDIRSVFAEEHLVYLGLQNEGGLLILDKETGRIQKHIQFSPLPEYSNTVTNIFPYHTDTLWIGTGKGILWFNKNNGHYGHLGIPPELAWMQKNYSLTIFEDSQKNIWASFLKFNSLVRYNRHDHTFSDVSISVNPLLRITFIFSMAEDLQGNIWLAGDGLCRYSIRKKVVDTLIPYPTVSDVIRNYMLILDRDTNNNLWLSSYDNEIIQYNCTTNTMCLRQRENNIIDGNTVTSSPIIDDNILMGTDNGISAFNIRDYSIKQFTYADGLPSVAITTVRKRSFYDRASNRFYIGARHRLISMVPDVSLSHKLPPPFFIERLIVKDSVIMPSANPVYLDYYQNNVTVLFNAINYTDPQDNRFAWRMPHNSDAGWNEINDQTSITLTNLADGWHPIEIKLFSVNNRWPAQVRSIGLYINPPFWRTGWFVMLVVVMLSAIIFAIYKKRINAVRKKEREKAQVQQLIAEEYKSRFELEQITNYFSSSLAGKKNVDEVLWDVTTNLIGRMNYEDCIIYMWNKDKTKMIQKAAYGPKGNPKEIYKQAFDVALGQGVVGHVMQSKEPLLVSDTRKDGRYRVDDMHRLSELCVPIILNNELIGIIDSEHQNPHHFQQSDIKILTTIATLVGNKIKQLESEQMLEVKQKEIASINQQLAEAQLAALQTQMNPHFIFNSLNSIKGMILTNERQQASRYLSKFANMIRITLNQSKKTFTTLYENVEHLESYLVMEKLRFDDSFTFTCTVDDDIDVEETMVPTLMLQPLAENAIWHGLMPKKGPKKLTIRFSRLDACICCTIEDNGIGLRQSEQQKLLTKSPYQSVGLDNLRNRIKILNEKYDTNCTLEINDLKEIDRTKTGTIAVLCFNINTNYLLI